MSRWMTCMLCKAALGVVLLAGFGCAGPQGPPGYSIEALTGSRIGNPFEIRLTTSGSELKAVLYNRSSSKQMLLHDPNLQASSLSWFHRRAATTIPTTPA